VVKIPRVKFYYWIKTRKVLKDSWALATFKDAPNNWRFSKRCLIR
jgi:hypothetical protein